MAAIPVPVSTIASRRALLAGALGGLGALAASAIGRASPVRADGEVIHVGQELISATTVTRLKNSVNANTVFWGESVMGVGLVGSSTSSYGILGFSDSNLGIKGTSESNNGVLGTSATQIGVSGVSQGIIGVSGFCSPGTGVEGNSISGKGVKGISVEGIGVYGTSSATDKPATLGWSEGDSTGVQGYSGEAPMPNTRYSTGVFGYANQHSAAVGVFGGSDVGIGVRGDSDSGWGVNGTSASNHGVWGSSTSGIGVYGTSDTSIGLYGTSESNYGAFVQTRGAAKAASVGFSSANGTGLLGFSGGDSSTPPAGKPKTGVYGYAAQDSTAKGVLGESTNGRAVQGSVSSSSGYAGYFSGRVFTNRFYEMSEIANPTAPGANRARLFIRDNGSGKTQLCVRYASGGVQVLNTQP